MRFIIAFSTVLGGLALASQTSNTLRPRDCNGVSTNPNTTDRCIQGQHGDHMLICVPHARFLVKPLALKIPVTLVIRLEVDAPALQYAAMVIHGAILMPIFLYMTAVRAGMLQRALSRLALVPAVVCVP